MKKEISLLGILAVLFISCTKADKSKPILEVFTPADNDIIVAGTTAKVKFHASDNNELSQVYLNIHDSFNGHGHTKSTITPFKITIIENLVGAEVDKEIEVFIPDTAAAGPYHLEMSVVDAKANLSSTVYRSFYIKNLLDTVAPTLNITNPIEGASFSSGAQLNLKGDGSDDQVLLKLEYTITRVGSDNKLVNASIPFNTSSEVFDENIVLNSTQFVSGNYELLCVLYDKTYNTSFKKITFKIN